MKTHPSPRTLGFSKTKKAALLVFSVAVLLAGGAQVVRGQSALDGFDPNANSIVQVVVVQPDGKILIGGDFTIVQGISRNRIARLNPDGTLDQLFDPNANGYVNTIAVQADGKILVGGSFNGVNSIGGQTRNRIARLDAATGAADLTFDPNADSAVYSIAVQADGRILAGGAFTSIGGTNRHRMARLEATNGLADSFNAAVSGLSVGTIVVQPDGRILVGGTFSGIGGQLRNHLARLDAATGLADSFNPNAPAGFYVVTALALQADGKVLAGGIFPSLGGTNRNSIARLEATTGQADSFNPNADNIVRSITVQPDGKILVGGDFTSIGGTNRNRIARLEASTGLADSFDPNANNGVNSIAVQADGKILAGGYFSSFAPNGGTVDTRNYIARLENDGRVDRSLNPGFSLHGEVFATAVQPDGKILIGGSFVRIDGVDRNYIARLNTDGTLDTSFEPNANSLVYSIDLQSDGRILVGGKFTSIGGVARNRIARLETNGVADSFNPNADYDVQSILVQADGKILVGGGFTNIAGQVRNRIARLDPTSGAVDSFNPNANGVSVQTVAVQSDGKILVGGQFSSIGAQARNRIARLDAMLGLADSFNPNAQDAVQVIVVEAGGTILAGGLFDGLNSIGGVTRNYIARLDPGNGGAWTFNPNASNEVRSIVVQTDGKILVGGRFLGMSGQLRRRIARLDTETGLADSFNPNANDLVNSITMQADGKILVGGFFNGGNSIGGQARHGLARLINTAAALQNLAVTPGTITWTRGGSSPLFTRVTFEASTNDVSYTFLGHGTGVGTNWALTNLNLPRAQNLYIRGRGYYRGAYQNSSGSIQEHVKNVFLPALPPLLNIQPSGTTNVVLSWVTNVTVFTLESKTNLTTGVWNVVTPGPVVSGTNNVVTNAVSGSTRYYRLRWP